MLDVDPDSTEALLFSSLFSLKDDLPTEEYRLLEIEFLCSRFDVCVDKESSIPNSCSKKSPACAKYEVDIDKRNTIFGTHLMIDFCFLVIR
jgi:hypothetical protein